MVVVGEQTSRLSEALREEMIGISEREMELETERERIISELAVLRRRKELMKALLESPGCGAEPVGLRKEEGASSTEARSSNGRGVADLALRILRERGKQPVHYRELAELVRVEGGDLSGPNPAQTLVAMIAKDERFVRPTKRGWYSLREFYPRCKNVGSRKKARPGRKPTGKAA